MSSPLSSLSAAAKSATAWMSPSITDKADFIKTVAKEVFDHLLKPEESSPAPIIALGGAGTDIVEFRSQTGPSFYKELKKKAWEPYEKSSLRESLRSKPWLSRKVLIEHYLDMLHKYKTRITYQIYKKIGEKWGYDAFFRVSKPGSEGLAIAFISHILLEDATKSPSIIFGKLIRFYTSIIRENKIPEITEPLKLALEALCSNKAMSTKLLSSEEDPYIKALIQGLVLSYYKKYGCSSELTLTSFIESLSHKKQSQAKTTQASFEGFSLTPLIPLLGPTQSILGVNALRKFTIIMSLIPDVLKKVHPKLIEASPPLIKDWISTLSPTKLLTCLEEDGITRLHTKAIEPIFLNLFTQELVEALIPYRSSILEGFSFAEIADFTAPLELIANEICSLKGLYLDKLLKIAPSDLYDFASILEHYEEALMQRQLDFIEYLSREFDVSFIVHRWQRSKEKNNSLKMNLIGSWDKPTCHLTLFPENNQIRVDLIPFKGLYTSRKSILELIHSHKLISFKRRSSKTLSILSEEDSSLSSIEKDYVKYILYFRLYVFICIQKLTHLKIPQLKKDTAFDLYGSKEEDLEEIIDTPYLAESEIAFKGFKLEKHLMNLIGEIGEIRYISEGIFSGSKHKDLLNEIKTVLKSDKKIIQQFHSSKLPFFISSLDTGISTVNQKITLKYDELKELVPTYSSLNPTKASLFTDLFSNPNATHLRSDAIVSLIPSLCFKKKPPKVFSEIHQLQLALNAYLNASQQNQRALQSEILTLFSTIKASKLLFNGFYTTQQMTFNAIFDQENISTKDLPSLKNLIPKTDVAHVELQALLNSMKTLYEKLKKQQELETILGASNLTIIQNLIHTIKSQKSDFIAFNPTKEAIFDRVINSTLILDITVDDLTAMRLVSIEDEKDPVYLQLKSLYETLKTLESLKTDQANLIAQQVSIDASSSSIEEDNNDSDDDNPDHASLASFGDGAGSIASYGSNLSMGSTEKLLEAFL